MFTLSISDFLKSPSTESTSTYGHLVKAFELKNGLASSPLVHCSFNNILEHKKVSFRYDMSNHEIHDFSFTDFDKGSLGELTDQDRELISQLLPVYFSRIELLVGKITKEMRQDWGREYKSEALERKGFCHYMSQASAEIEKTCRLNMVKYTLSNLTKKRVHPFQVR